MGARGGSGALTRPQKRAPGEMLPIDEILTLTTHSGYGEEGDAMDAY